MKGLESPEKEGQDTFVDFMFQYEMIRLKAISMAEFMFSLKDHSCCLYDADCCVRCNATALLRKLGIEKCEKE